MDTDEIMCSYDFSWHPDVKDGEGEMERVHVYVCEGGGCEERSVCE